MKTRERITTNDRNTSVLFQRHMSSYLFSQPFVRGKRILEVGCSDGYGSFLISPVTESIVALDLDNHAIREAARKYQSSKIKFIAGDALSLPWENEFDVVISFQVIEHIKDVDLYLEQIKKTLKKGGTAIISTPNRLLRLNKGQKPWNRFHVHEYEAGELKKLLSKHFSGVSLQGISASAHIYSMEKKRLKLRRIIARLDPFCLYDRIPSYISDWVLSKAKSVLLSKKKYLEISPSDFWVSKEDVNKSLDIIAICKK